MQLIAADDKQMMRTTTTDDGRRTTTTTTTTTSVIHSLHSHVVTAGISSLICGVKTVNFQFHFSFSAQTGVNNDLFMIYAMNGCACYVSSSV